LLLDEYFEDGDERFLPELLAFADDKRLVAFAPRFYGDRRPFARGALLAWIDDGCDRTGHRPLVKRVFKAAEKAGDEEAMAHFLVAFDRLPQRKLVESTSWDWQAREQVTRLVLKRVAPPGGAEGHFGSTTRSYLARRAFRFFRTIGRKDPARYGRAIRKALVLYRDEHLATPEQLLDAWGLLNALYWKSPVIERRSRGARVVPGKSLRDLVPAPIYPEAWQGCFADVLALAERAESRTVRAFALRLLRADYAKDLAGLELARLRVLLRSPREDVQLLAAELLPKVKGLDGLSIADWLELLQIETPAVLPLVCDLVARHVSPARLTLAQCVELAAARAAPVAKLGLAWAREKAKGGPALPDLLPLANAGVPAVREEGLGWVLELLGDPAGRPEHLREIIDARHSDSRTRALARLGEDARFRDRPELWSALAESPYDDVRKHLVDHLRGREAALTPGTLRHVWATTLLAVHRGGRAKQAVLRQLADRIAASPAEAEALVPLLRIALRSVRAPERRGAIAAVARAALSSPELRRVFEVAFPELVLHPEVSE
jgi:hypothetical protein